MVYFGFIDISREEAILVYVYTWLCVYSVLFILSFYSFIRFYNLLRCMAVRVMATGLIAVFSFTRVVEYVSIGR